VAFLGPRVRELRERQGVRQSELARRLGENRQRVNKWERGWSDLQHEDVPRVADALGITICELYGREERHDVASAQQLRERDIIAHRLEQLVQQMTPADQALVDAIASWKVAERARLRAEEGLSLDPLATMTPARDHSARAS
jgi:transcriptional regulator with XRE-family HTH domain